MRGVYRVGQKIAAVTTAEPLLYIITPSDTMIEILSARVSCSDEVTSEQLHCRLTRVASGTKSGGDAITPKPTEEQGPASGCTASGGNTAITGLTMEDVENCIYDGSVSKLGVWEYVPLPEERPIITINDELVLELLDTLTSCDLEAEIIYREIG